MKALRQPKNLLNAVLMLFVLGNIAMDVANIAVWIAIPSMQSSLQSGPIAETLGSTIGLAAGTAILSAASITYAIALFGLYRKQKWAPLLVIAVSVANRAFSVAIFQATYPIFYAWTGTLIFVALLDYWLLSKPPKAIVAIGLEKPAS